MEIPSLGQCHVIILHFPIVLFWTALFYDFLGVLGKAHIYPAVHWIVIAAALFTIPTLITGLALTDDFKMNPYFYLHRTYAFATLAFGFLQGSYRFSLILRKKSSCPLFLLRLSLINIVLVSITSAYGGKIAFGY